MFPPQPRISVPVRDRLEAGEVARRLSVEPVLGAVGGVRIQQPLELRLALWRAESR